MTLAQIKSEATEHILDGIPYRLVRSKRKTLEVAVHPDQHVVVKASLSASLTSIEQWLIKRIAWVRKQLKYFEQLGPSIKEHSYTSGETHLYLGKEYVLRVRPALFDAVFIHGRTLEVAAQDCQPSYVKALLDAWYRERAEECFTELVDACWEHFSLRSDIQYAKPIVTIRDMRTRWGSISNTGRMSLNLRLIHTSQKCIEYVILHEFCHLRHANHGEYFWKMVGSMMPRWTQYKNKLDAYRI